MGGEEACPPVLNTAEVPGRFLNGRERTAAPASPGPGVPGASFNRTWHSRQALESVAGPAKAAPHRVALSLSLKLSGPQALPSIAWGRCACARQKSGNDDEQVTLGDSSLHVGSHVRCLSCTDSFNPRDVPSTQVLLLVGKLRPREAEPRAWSRG